MSTAFSAALLGQALQDIGLEFPTRLAVAFSGGADSTALLHGLVALREAEQLTSDHQSIRALHFNHRIHPDSDRWQFHCEQLCADRSIPLICGVWQQSPGPECSEDAARQARYEWLTEQLIDGEVLLTAHHADDQVETLLLNLFQGRDLHRLVGIPDRRPLGGTTGNQRAAMVYRPLLSVRSEALRRYLVDNDIGWIEDPANHAQNDRRSFLRQRLLPLIRERFENADAAMLRTADNLGTAYQWRQQQIAEALNLVLDPAPRTVLCRGVPLDLPGMLMLEPGLRSAVIRQWVHGQGFGAPTDRQLEELWRQLNQRLGADQEQSPAGIAMRFGAVEVVATRSNLHLLDQVLAQESAIPVHASCNRLTEHLTVRFIESDQPGLSRHSVDSGRLVWRWRQGGERFQTVGGSKEEPLKVALQRKDVPGFERARLPLLWDGDQLLWVHRLGFTRHLLTDGVGGETGNQWVPGFALR